MNVAVRLSVLYALLLLLFIQTAGTLVESAYILSLQRLAPAPQAIAIPILAAPVLAIPFLQIPLPIAVWINFAILFFARGLLPYLATGPRVLGATLGLFAVVNLLMILFSTKRRSSPGASLGTCGSAGLALAVSASVLVRAAGLGLDYSLVRGGGWIGWGLVAGLGLVLQPGELTKPSRAPGSRDGLTAATLGVWLVLALVWFSFSAPAVIARWTEANYPLVCVVTSLSVIGWGVLALVHPRWTAARAGRRGILLANLAFCLALTTTLLTHRITFPPTPHSPPVVVGAPSWATRVPLAAMLLLCPILLFDARLFLTRIERTAGAPRELLAGFLLGGAAVAALVLAQIFTNVWGYVEPVSGPLRNHFWLPYAAASGLVAWLTWRVAAHAGAAPSPDGRPTGARTRWGWAILLVAISISTAVLALAPYPAPTVSPTRDALVVMTLNTQQCTDQRGQKSAESQLALIRRISPDILALQETDSTRVALNNNDYVRFFAAKLGYYAYYGPTTVTGTFGAAILSKYPLLNPRTVFTFSDRDEVAIAEVEIEAHGRRITVYNVHPAGSDAAQMAFARALVARLETKPYAIAAGDFNLRAGARPYQLIETACANAWQSVQSPDARTADGARSADRRIDHIFVSRSLRVADAFYIEPDESASDHPAHVARIVWPPR